MDVTNNTAQIIHAKILYCMMANLVRIIISFEVLRLFYPDNMKRMV